MKNKKLTRNVIALLAALVLMGGFTVPAYAGGGDEDYCDWEPTQEPAEPQPLTPEGNMTLVDDIDGEAAEDKQFITVVSKSGNYFYIIIDRAEDGENTVHFLNQVDEADLMAIIGEEETEEPTAVCSCKDKFLAGSVNSASPVFMVNMSECGGKAAEPEPEEPEPPAEQEKGGAGVVLLVAVVLVAAGGAFYYMKILKPKKDAAKGNTDLDDYDFDEDEETEYEDDLDDENGREDNK